ADRAVEAAFVMHSVQTDLNETWTPRELPHFNLGIGLSTGEVAAVLLGSDERLEYTVIGDSVNLAQRLQQLAGGGEIVLSAPTFAALKKPLEVEDLGPVEVKGRHAKIGAYRVGTRGLS
ncbi:MAG: adenylate/guanylate cyclase domain-containing protein, partial [Actinomycetota bacterium]|nr:adenylate/guanylate cyclase domain-containing protein [Actinomycetota bacterium]